MTEAERIARGEQRRYIFENFCNGVPIEDQMPVSKMSHLEVENAIIFVAKKIQGSRFKNLHGIGPVLARLRNELGKPAAKRNTEALADSKAEAKTVNHLAGTPIEIDLLSDIRANRILLLQALAKLGPLCLSSELAIPRVHLQKADNTPGMIEDIRHRLMTA